MDTVQNPGEQLREILMRILPKDTYSQSTFLTRVDRVTNAEGNLADLIYNSTINYVLRRMISTACFLKRHLEVNGSIATEEKINTELRSYLRNHMNIEETKNREKIVALLKECIKAREKEVTQKRKNAIKRMAKQADDHCYMCGNSIDYHASDSKTSNSASSFKGFIHNAPEIEHIWPRAMGGVSEGSNLKIACAKCNRNKQDSVDSTDFHYEKVCIASDENDNNFANEFDIVKKLAIWSKSNFSCTNCNRSVSEVGPLQLAREDEKDSWHYINVSAFCSFCYEKLKR